jgi:hypothetical protein
VCSTSDSHNLIERCAAYDPADIEDAIAQLKLYCGLVRSPLVRQRCLSAVLALRSRQHTVAMGSAREVARN